MKRKVENMKATEKATRTNNAESHKAMKARQDIVIKEHNHYRKKLSTQLHRLEVKS